MLNSYNAGLLRNITDIIMIYFMLFGNFALTEALLQSERGYIEMYGRNF